MFGGRRISTSISQTWLFLFMLKPIKRCVVQGTFQDRIHNELQRSYAGFCKLQASGQRSDDQEPGQPYKDQSGKKCLEQTSESMVQHYLRNFCRQLLAKHDCNIAISFTQPSGYIGPCKGLYDAAQDPLKSNIWLYRALQRARSGYTGPFKELHAAMQRPFRGPYKAIQVPLKSCMRLYRAHQRAIQSYMGALQIYQAIQSS